MSDAGKIFFHIDVNSAFLSWTATKMLNEGYEIDLRLVPSIIGGDSEKRHGIVLAKSIPASKLGIKTAEPIVSAFRKCPTLINLPSDFETYRYYSHALMEHLEGYCPDIEQVSIDECYMDFTPIRHRFSSPEEAAYIIKDSVKNTFGFTVNVGISDKKVLAKMASDLEKPDKVHTLFTSEIKEKMWPLPVGDLYMCGRSSQDYLYKLGIRTIGDLARFDKDILSQNLKSHGSMLHDFANGIDDSDICTVHERLKGIGNSTTLSHDLTSREEAKNILLELSDKVAFRLRNDERKASLITTEIKYSNFVSCSKQMAIEKPTDTQSGIYENALSLFDSLWNGEPIRLLGIRTSKLVDKDEPYQMTLFDYTDEATIEKNVHENKEEKINSALDKVKDKFGDVAVTKGYIKNRNK